MADVVLTQRVDDAGLAGRVTVSSCGTGDWHVGQPMDQRAAATLVAADYDPSQHRARQFDATWLEANDLVLAMDDTNLDDVRRADPQVVAGPASGCSATSTRSSPVATYRTRTTVGKQGFEEVLAMVERTCAALVAALQQTPASSIGPGRLVTRQPVARPARRGAARLLRGRDRPGGRRRHLHRDQAPALRRHHRDHEDPLAPAGRLLRLRGGRAALAGRGRRRRAGARGARRRRGVPDPALGRARQGLGRRRGRRSGRRSRPPTRPAHRRRTAATADGFISKLPLPNTPCDSWAEFYAVRRVLPYLKLARDRGAVSEDEAGAGRGRHRQADRAAARGAAGPPARRPLERQRAVGPGEPGLDDRPGGVRRPPRARPGDARAVRHAAPAAGARGLPGARPRWPRAGRSASRCTSSSRCWCTPRCSAAATAPAPPTPRLRPLRSDVQLPARL